MSRPNSKPNFAAAHKTEISLIDVNFLFLNGCHKCFNGTPVFNNWIIEPTDARSVARLAVYAGGLYHKVP